VQESRRGIGGAGQHDCTEYFDMSQAHPRLLWSNAQARNMTRL
jgi:hypothetical protein